jgi:hypothetical protein
MALKEVFSQVSCFFEREHFEYAIIGAFALYGYGYARATMDIDFVTLLKYQGTAIKYLESIGFETTHRSSAFSNHLHPLGNLRVDIMYVDEKTGKKLFSAVTRRTILKDVIVPIVAPEHLLAMKLFSASNDPDRTLKDLADVKELIKNTSLDAELVKQSFAKYGLMEYYDRIYQ